MHTVNVLKKIGDSNITLTAYADNAQGIRDAEQKFSDVLTKFVMEQNLDMPVEDYSDYLEDGFYERNNFSLFLIHST